MTRRSSKEELMTKRLMALLMGIVAAAFFAAPAFATQDPGSGTGYLEVCKASSSPIVTGPFSFSVNGGSAIAVNVGECSAPMIVPAGTATIHETETLTPDGYGHSFSSYDSTAVSAIHTSAPGSPDSALVLAGTSLTDRTAEVTIAQGDQSTETVVTFTNDPVQGYVEVCKTQDLGAGLDGQMFPFTVYGALGFSQTVSVTVGACSDPILAPAGHVIVQENGLATYVDSITTLPANALWDYNLANAWASVGVTKNGTQSGESIVDFNNDSSQLKICKIAAENSTPLIDQSYTFNVNGTMISVTAGADPGHCVIVPTHYTAGTSITVTEVPQPGQSASNISIAPVGRTFVQSGSDFLGQSATFIIGSGITTLTYTDALADPGMLKVCKNGPAGEPNAVFTVAGPRGTAPNIVPGSDTLSVPVGQCVLDPTLLPYAGAQTVTETALSGYVVSTITVADPDRLVAGSANTAAGSVGAYIGSGTTIVTYTNVAGAPPAAPVVTSAASGSDPAAPAVAASVLAGASSTATTASASAPKVAKVHKAASVSMARIVTLKSGRYVNVRVNGANGKATIRVTLIGRNGKVLMTVLRSVKTNQVVRVANLKLGPSVRSIRVAVT
jgi:hypothetical protein